MLVLAMAQKLPALAVPGLPTAPLTLWIPVRDVTGMANVELVFVPLASWPPELSPQHQSSPVLSRPQKLLVEAAIETMLVSEPDAVSTVTGVVPPLVVVDPSPNAPRESSPQQLTSPVESTAQVALPATAISTILAEVVTSYASVTVALIGSPAWPFALLPQQAAVALVVTTQACAGPTDTAVAP